MRNIEVEAVYKCGALKPSQQLPLAEGQRVTITVHATSAAPSRRRAPLLRWKGSLGDLMYLAESDDNSLLERGTVAFADHRPTGVHE